MGFWNPNEWLYWKAVVWFSHPSLVQIGHTLEILTVVCCRCRRIWYQTKRKGLDRRVWFWSANWAQSAPVWYTCLVYNAYPKHSHHKEEGVRQRVWFWSTNCAHSVKQDMYLWTTNPQHLYYKEEGVRQRVWFWSANCVLSATARAPPQPLPGSTSPATLVFPHLRTIICTWVQCSVYSVPAHCAFPCRNQHQQT